MYLGVAEITVGSLPGGGRGGYLRSNRGNDNIVFLLTPVLKTGVEIERTIFWSEIGSGFGEPGGTPPPQVPRNTPRVRFRVALEASV